MYKCPSCFAESLGWWRRTGLVLTERTRCSACGIEITENVWQRRLFILVAMPLVGFGSFTVMALIGVALFHSGYAFWAVGISSFFGGGALVVGGPNRISPLRRATPAPASTFHRVLRVVLSVASVIGVAFTAFVGVVAALALGILS